MPGRLFIVPILLLALAIDPGGTHAQSASADLLQPAHEFAAAPDSGLAGRDHRRRLMRADPSALASDTLALALFPDVELQAVRTPASAPAAGADVWTGHVTGDPFSSVTLVAVDGVLQGAVRVGARAFSLQPDARSGLTLVRELDPRALGAERVPLTAPPGSMAVQAADADGPRADDGSTIDVLVVYTASAREQAGGTEAAIQARIALGITETNQAYAASGVAQRVRLVGAELVGYHESGDIALDLQDLTDRTDGVMDGVHARRDATGADLVQLVVGPASSNACGVAWLMQAVTTNFAPLAFSVVEYDCISPNYTFGHELAHNMGSAHAPEDPNPAPSFPYSYGYKHPDAHFRTVMAYDCPDGCPRVLRFSNPLVEYGGEPTGIAGRQDNARSLDATALTVANFRPSVDPAVRLSSPQAFTVDGTGTTAVLSWTPPVTGPVLSYIVEAGSEPGFADVATLVVTAPATTVTVTDIQPGQYFVRVRAYGTNGPGAPSDTVPILMTPSGRCIEPAGPPTIAPPLVAGHDVTVTWTAPTTGGVPDSHVIGAGHRPQSIDAGIIETGSAALTARVLADDGVYFVRVAGRNACGIGTPSNEVVAVVGPPIPGPPANLFAVVHPDRTVTLRWDAPAAGGSPDGYVVEAGTATGRADIARLGADGTSTVFTTAAEPRLYFVRVRAVNAAGESAPSNEMVVFVQ
ncbi:MAG: fibronectin type III domain-containing protein [Vicinamibacterales bacterium]